MYAIHTDASLSEYISVARIDADRKDDQRLTSQ